ncbi:MAG: GNAT family acetyltransferase [Pseudomonadota bacterium]
MLIRAYQHADESAVVELWEACKLTRPWNDPGKDIARKLSVQRELFLVGEVDGVVMASIMCGYDGHRGWVNYLAVKPGFQKRGHGQALMQAAEQALLAMGCPKLNLQVRSTNADVLAFYRHIGYVQDDVVTFGRRLIPDV